MTLTIGRTSGLRPTKASPSYNGNTISIEGTYPAASVDALRAARQQLLGYADNPDEPHVVVIWASDPTLDGFYSVRRMSVEVRTPIGTERILFFKCDLERVAGGANPWFEVLVDAVVRPNGHGVTAPKAAMVTYSYGTSPNPDINLPSALLSPSSNVNFTTSAGVDIFRSLYTAPISSSYRFNSAPSVFLNGACQIEIKYGSSWYVVVGRDIPRATEWRISNGLIRITAYGLSESLVSYSTFEVWNGSAWESVNITHWLNGAVDAPIGGQGVPVSVYRNSLEQVTVSYNVGTATYSRLFTYTLQRGAFHFSSSWSSSAAEKWGIGLASGSLAAGTAFTGGVRTTGVDVNGNKMAFGTAAANSNDTTNTATWYTTAATAGSVWAGVDLNAVGGSAYTDLRDQFLGAVSWQQRVAPR